ncbi:MAG: anti-sigma factor, partial [Nocardioidaceae bacterium]
PQVSAAEERGTETASPIPTPSHVNADPVPRITSNVVPMRRSRATLVTSLLAAAAIVTAIGFGGWALQSRQDAQVATRTASQLTQLLSADDVQTVPGVSQKADHTGAIVMSRSEGKAFFVAAELPSLPNDQVYEAWTIKGSTDPVPAGTFRPNASSQVITALPAGAFQADSVAITVEPKGGTDQPTSDAVVTFVMPQA